MFNPLEKLFEKKVQHQRKKFDRRVLKKTIYIFSFLMKGGMGSFKTPLKQRKY